LLSKRKGLSPLSRPDLFNELPTRHTSLIHSLINFSKPLVAAVHGVAIGGGTTILTHCDFVYAAENTKFQIPFINLALVPEFGSSFSLPRQIGYLQAAELILLGGTFNAARASELGLVTAVVPDTTLLAKATETAQTLARKSVVALRSCKDLMKRPQREQLEQAVARELQEFAVRVRSAETKEAIAAFFEKRPPDFSRTRLARRHLRRLETGRPPQTELL
jgi:enoyl-CoA hydratase/carnithine racemase